MLPNLDTLLGNLFSTNPPAKLSDDDCRIACAALLVHCAKADGHQSPAEDKKLREILRDQFTLSTDDVETLIERASKQQADAVDLHRFTRVIHQNLDRDGRKAVVRSLWEITHADGTIDHEERSIVTLIARLLHVEIRDAVSLRQSVVAPKSD